jgi:hypothetical protein
MIIVQQQAIKGAGGVVQPEPILDGIARASRRSGAGNREVSQGRV